MKHPMLKKIIASLMAVCMIAGAIPSAAFADEFEALPESNTQIITGEKVDAERSSSKTAEVNTSRPGFDAKTYEPDEMVTVIVVLDEPAAASYYDQAQTMAISADDDTLSPGKKLAQFLSSEQALAITAENKAQQDALASQISALAIQNAAKNQSEQNGTAAISAVSSDTEVIARFTGVINAMSVRMPYSLLDSVKRLDGVKTAYVEKTYSIPPEESLSPLDGGIERYSYSLAGVNGLWKEGYTGKGMVVAVLDTSLDLEYAAYWDPDVGANVEQVRRAHEAFRDNSFKSENPSNFVAYTQGSIAKILNAVSSELIVGDISDIGKVAYKNLKVPFAMDYSRLSSEGIIDYNVRSDETHGTHVSGTILGYARDEDGAVKFSGIAPDAQLMFMKVFEDDGNMSSSTPLLAALNDAAYLGADVVNLSLGSDNGFSYEDTAEELFFEMLEAAGVIVSASNGNSGQSQELNNGTSGHPLTENPDISTAGSPAMYGSAIAIASVNNTVIGTKYLVWTEDGVEHKIPFTDTGTVPGGYLFGEVNSGEMTQDNAIYDCGLGYPEDYSIYDWKHVSYPEPSYNPVESGDASGFALVQRGTISFVEKIQNGIASNDYQNQVTEYNPETYTSFPVKGLRGIIVYNNEPGTFGMDLTTMEGRNDSYPAISISQADGEQIKAAIDAGKNVTIKLVGTEDEAGEWSVTPDSVDIPGEISSFSSWGAGPGLELKPDIATPGGRIYSSVNDASYSGGVGTYSDYTGSYEFMDGTSMAAPHFTGISALVSQALNESSNAFYKNRSTDERATFAEHLLISTAVPIVDSAASDGAYITPRRQGAGLVNGGAAVKTPVFIYVDGANVGKLELKDDADWSGSFDYSFNIMNTTAEAHQYKGELIVMTPETSTDAYGRAVFGNHDRIISKKDLGVINVNPGISVTTTVSGSIEYNPAEIKAYAPNGTFIEGYIRLTPVSEDIPEIGLPFLGFAGDWTAAPNFDTLEWWEISDGNGNYNEKLDKSTFMDPETYGFYYGITGYFNEYMTMPEFLGSNPFDYEYSQFMNDGPYHMGNFTISPNGDGHVDSLNYFEMYQLRDARELVFEVTDTTTGEIYYHDYTPCFPRTPFEYDSNYGMYFPYPFSLYLMSAGFEYDGFKITDQETWESEPLPTGTEVNFSVAAFGEGDYQYAVDDTGVPFADGDSILISDPSTWPTFNNHPMDMTGDIISYDVLIDTEAPTLVNSAASLTKQDDGTYLFECEFDDDYGSIASVEIDPYIKYTIKDEYKDLVDAYGLEPVEYDTGSPIDFQLIYDEDVHTYKYSCELPDPETLTDDSNSMYDGVWSGTFYVFCGDYGANDSAYVFDITDESTESGILAGVWDYGTLYVGESAPLTIIDNTGVEGPVTFTSSNENVVTVDENGTVTAVGPGTAIITLTKGDATATVVITVSERADTVTDFRFSIEDYSAIRPGESIVIRAEDIVPLEYNGANGLVLTQSEWTVTDPNWQHYEEGGDPFTVVVNDIPGRDYYLKEADITFNSEYASYYTPGSSGTLILTATLNGCTKSTTINYEIPAVGEDYLISTDYTQTMTEYIEMGEGVNLAAQYSDPSQHVAPEKPVVMDVKVYSKEGYNWDYLQWSGEVEYQPSEGLSVVPDFGVGSNGYYEGYLVAAPGYDLPDSIYVGIHDTTDDSYTPMQESYGQFTYDSTTGKITILSLPYYETSEVAIHADGMAREGAPGTNPPEGYVPPVRPNPDDNTAPEIDGLYGPFDWTVTEFGSEAASYGLSAIGGFGGMNAVYGIGSILPYADNQDSNIIQTEYGTIVLNSDYENSVTFTPNAPGVYRVTATNKAGTAKISWIVVVDKIATDSSVQLVPEITGEEISGVKYSLVIDENAEQQLVVKAYDEFGNEIPLPDDLVWESNDDSVVTVDPQTGVVTAVGAGIATVTVKSRSNQSVNAHFVIQVEDTQNNNPPAAHRHRFIWRYDISSHWQACLDCGATLARMPHQFRGTICVVCGYFAPYAQPEPYEKQTVDLEFEIIGEDGAPVEGLSVQLRSLPRQATTSALGTVTFSGVEFGTHTISVLDSVGRIITSKSFNLISGNTLQINDTAITAAPGSKVNLTLVYSGDDLTIADADDSVLIDIPTEAKFAKEECEEVYILA